MSHLHDHKDRGVAKNEQEFLDWVCQQDSEQEERQETPKRNKKPIVPECYVYVFEQTRTQDPDYV